MADESFYNPGERRASSVNALFDAIARRYDLMNDLQSFGLHRVWKRRLLRLANPQPGARALDVCCGTGDIAIAMAKRGASVVGLDFSQEMLAVAQVRTSGVSCPSTADAEDKTKALDMNFICGDAMRLPFPEASFEIVTVGYGLRNLASYETGLREMQRVANPGGRLLVLDFGKPDNALWRAIYFGYLRCFVPLLGRLFAGSAAAYSYILESLEPYPAQHGVAGKMREIGLTQVRVLNLLGGVMSIHYGEKPRTSLSPAESRCQSENTLSKMPG